MRRTWRDVEAGGIFGCGSSRGENCGAGARDCGEKHLTLAANENVHSANNPWKRTEFAAKAPGLDWEEYFRGAGLESRRASSCGSQARCGRIGAGASEPLDTWKDLLAYHVIEAYGAVLPKAFADDKFAFFGKALQGTTGSRPALGAGSGHGELCAR